MATFICTLEDNLFLYIFCFIYTYTFFFFFTDAGSDDDTATGVGRLEMIREVCLSFKLDQIPITL